MDIQHRFAVPITQPRMHFFAKDGKPLVELSNDGVLINSDIHINRVQ